MSTVVGYAVIAALFGGYTYYVYNKNAQKKLSKATALKSKQDRQAPAPTKKEPKESKPKRQRLEDTQRDSYASKLKSQPPTTQAYTTSFSSDDDGVDNREFARLLSNAKEGTKFTSKSKQDVRAKSVKQSMQIT